MISTGPLGMNGEAASAKACAGTVLAEARDSSGSSTTRCLRRCSGGNSSFSASCFATDVTALLTPSTW